MSAADRAVANAIPLEVKKDGLQQRQNGDWVLRLVVQAADMDPRLTNAAMGTRFQAALVEVGDDELPKERGKLDWRDVQPAAQAGIRCAEPRFRDYLAVEHGFSTQTAEQAAIVVRQLCKVESRSELSSNHKARALWHSIDSGYREWAHL
jgi:hypothetical protein